MPAPYHHLLSIIWVSKGEWCCGKQPLYLSVKKAETEPGQDAKPPCPSTDLPSISGQGMDFQREPECMHHSKGSYCLLDVHFLCLFHPILNIGNTRAAYAHSS